MNTGYKGRIAIYELLLIDDKIREFIIAKISTQEIAKYAVSKGIISLKQDGISKIQQGLTSVEEVLRVTEEE